VKIEDARKVTVFLRGGRAIRSHPNYKTAPISEETFVELLAALDQVYPGKWRRAVDICPAFVSKTIDNEADALETIQRIEERGRGRADALREEGK
jgi:hypothetical protein